MPLLAPARRQASPSVRRTVAALASVGLIAAAAVLTSSAPVSAGIVATVPLATVDGFSVLGAETVTNTGFSVIGRSVGLSPGTAIEGFPPGVVQAPATIQAANATTLQAQVDLTTAYVNAAGRPTEFPDTSADLVGLTLQPGVYSTSSRGALSLSGALVLDGLNNSAAVFIFQTDSSLITASNSTISFINGASPCNVFWQVGSSATLGTDSVFVGTILAQTSVWVQTGAEVQGRALARTGEVTLDDNVFSALGCAASPPATTTTTTTTIAPVDTTAPAVTTVAPGFTVAPEVTSPGETTTPPVTTTPSAGTTVITTVPVNRNQTTTTDFTVTDITIPRTGSSTTSTSIAGSAFLVAGAIALLVSRRRRPL